MSSPSRNRVPMTIVGALFAVYASPVWAADSGPDVLVLEFRVADDVAGDLGRISERAVAEVIAGSGYAVAALSELRSLREVQAARESVACRSEADCAAQIAEGFDAEIIVTGRIGRVGASITLSLTRIDRARSTVVARAARVATEPEALARVAAAAGAELFGATETRTTSLLLPSTGVVRFVIDDLDSEGLSPDVRAVLTEVVSAEVMGLDSAKVINREDIEALLGVRAARSMLGAECDDACLVEIGGALDADFVVSGLVGRLDDVYAVSLSATSPRTLESHRWTETFRGQESALVGALRHAARSLLGRADTRRGTLQISASVVDATVHVDAEELGRLPLPPVESLDHGRHSVRVVKDGFLDWQQDVYVNSGRTSALWAELSPAPKSPWYEKWWIWAIAGAVAAGGVGAAVILSQPDGDGQAFVRLP